MASSIRFFAALAVLVGAGCGDVGVGNSTGLTAGTAETGSAGSGGSMSGGASGAGPTSGGADASTAGADADSDGSTAGVLTEAGDATDSSGGDGGSDLQEEPIMGVWTGTATVVAGDVLLGGDFPVRIAVAQSNQQIAGTLDLQQDQGFGAEAFGYSFTGELVDGDLTLTLTDRQCGGVVCYPNGGIEPVFTASGSVSAGQMMWDSVGVLAGIVYGPEAPFEDLTVTWQDSYEPDTIDFANAWVGDGHVPVSVIWALPGPMFGTTTLEISGVAPDFAMQTFINRDITYVPPYADDIIWPSSFAADVDTGRMWFLQGGTLIYLGQKHGNRLTAIIADESGHHQAGADPVPFADIPVEDVVGVMSLELQ